MEKKRIRNSVREEKKQLSQSFIRDESKKLFSRVEQMPVFTGADMILCYVSYNQEVDTHAFIKKMIHSGKKIAVPKILDGKMEFCLLSDFSELKPGYQGILEPSESKIVWPKEALMIVPGLAFDRSGNRVGYGGGFYDRYLSFYENCGMITAAVCFLFQVVEQIDAECYDKKVDFIITPDEIIPCKG